MRRTTLQPLAALLLAGMLVAPGAAASTGAAGEETVTGVLEAYHVDEFTSDHEHEGYDVRTSHGPVELAFGDGDPDPLIGATVTVTGTRSGRVLTVASAKPGRSLRVIRAAKVGESGTVAALDSSGTTTSGSSLFATSNNLATSTTPVAKSLAVILINFQDLTTQPWTKSTVQAAVTGTSSIKAFYEEESKGRMTMAGSVFGWYTISDTTAGCDWPTWQTLGANAATAAGVNLSAYTNVMFIWPQTSQCAWAGLGYMPGTYTYINGNISVQVMTHELGHNFGLAHANARNCVVNGTRVTIAADASCATQAYADPFSTMGNNALRHNQGSQLGELGWLSSSEITIGSPGNTYTVSPYFSTGTTKLVRVPRGDGTFFDLDIRTPYGTFDNFSAGSPAVSGVTIRLGRGTASPTYSPQATELLDTTPSTTDLKDAPLLVGKSITDPVSKISFTTLSVDSSGVTVRVREGIAPSAPSALDAATTDTPTVELSWTAATDNVAVDSYRISRDGTLLTTVPSTAVVWSDGSVAAGTGYTYTVAAVDTSGNVGAAASVSVTTPGAAPDPTPTPSPDPTPSPTPTPNPDVQAPTAPDPLSGTPATTTVSLAWGAASDDVGVAGYQVTRNGVKVTTVTGSASGWTDTGRAPLTTYTYAVAAVDAAGNASSATEVSVTTTADTVKPTTPKHFHVSSRSGVYVTFAWSPSTDNVKVVKYLIYRAGKSTPVASTRSRVIKIKTLYHAYYYVKAVDAAGNRSPRSALVRGR